MTTSERKREDAEIRKDFPLLSPKTAYLDNSATTQKPRQVLEAVSHYYESENALRPQTPMSRRERLSVLLSTQKALRKLFLPGTRPRA